MYLEDQELKQLVEQGQAGQVPFVHRAIWRDGCSHAMRRFWPVLCEEGALEGFPLLRPGGTTGPTLQCQDLLERVGNRDPLP